MRFEEILDRELTRLGCTNAELAAVSGLGKSTVSRYRRGEREPRWGSAQLWQLAKGLNALGDGDDASLNALFSALGESLSTGLRLDHATYLTRLGALCRCLDIRSSALARALAYGGNLVLLDEPFRGLDEATRDEVIGLCREVLREKTTILVTHDRAEAEALADVIYTLSPEGLQ